MPLSPGRPDCCSTPIVAAAIGVRSRVWKAQLQDKIADGFDLEVTVCHLPTGCSKWNPIEHP